MAVGEEAARRKSAAWLDDGFESPLSVISAALRCAGEERDRVECAGGFVFVLEVDVDVALLGERGEALGERRKFQRGVAAVRRRR